MNGSTNRALARAASPHNDRSPRLVTFASEVSIFDDDNTTIDTEDDAEERPQSLFSGRWIGEITNSSSSSDDEEMAVVEITNFFGEEPEHDDIVTTPPQSILLNGKCNDALDKSPTTAVTVPDVVESSGYAKQEVISPVTCSPSPRNGHQGQSIEENGLPASPLHDTYNLALVNLGILEQADSPQRSPSSASIASCPLSPRSKMWTRLVDGTRALIIFAVYTSMAIGAPLCGSGGIVFWGIKVAGVLLLCCLAMIPTSDRGEQRGLIFECFCSRKTCLLVVYICAWTFALNAAEDAWNTRKGIDTTECERARPIAWLDNTRDNVLKTIVDHELRLPEGELNDKLSGHGTVEKIVSNDPELAGESSVATVINEESVQNFITEDAVVDTLALNAVFSNENEAITSDVSGAPRRDESGPRLHVNDDPVEFDFTQVEADTDVKMDNEEMNRHEQDETDDARTLHEPDVIDADGDKLLLDSNEIHATDYDAQSILPESTPSRTGEDEADLVTPVDHMGVIDAEDTNDWNSESITPLAEANGSGDDMDDVNAEHLQTTETALDSVDGPQPISNVDERRYGNADGESSEIQDVSQYLVDLPQPSTDADDVTEEGIDVTLKPRDAIHENDANPSMTGSDLDELDVHETDVELNSSSRSDTDNKKEGDDGSASATEGAPELADLNNDNDGDDIDHTSASRTDAGCDDEDENPSSVPRFIPERVEPQVEDEDEDLGSESPYEMPHEDNDDNINTEVPVSPEHSEESQQQPLVKDESKSGEPSLEESSIPYQNLEGKAMPRFGRPFITNGWTRNPSEGESATDVFTARTMPPFDEIRLGLDDWSMPDDAVVDPFHSVLLKKAGKFAKGALRHCGNFLLGENYKNEAMMNSVSEVWTNRFWK